MKKLSGYFWFVLSFLVPLTAFANGDHVHSEEVVKSTFLGLDTTQWLILAGAFVLGLVVAWWFIDHLNLNTDVDDLPETQPEPPKENSDSN